MRHAILFAVAIVASSAPTVAAEDDAAILRRQAQELRDAVTNGDPKVWETYLDPQLIYIDEAGAVSDKPGLVAQIKPLPAGISGSIKTEVTQLHIVGDLAVMQVDAHE